MDVIYGLIPMMLVFGFLVVIVFIWMAKSGHFDDLDGAANRIFMDDEYPEDKKAKDKKAKDKKVKDKKVKDKKVKDKKVKDKKTADKKPDEKKEQDALKESAEIEPTKDNANN